MNNTLSSYVLSSTFMVFILCILIARAFSAITEKVSRKRSLFLIGTTIAYVVTDCIFIVCHLSSNLGVHAWKAVSFVFYAVYTVLPFAWHVFVRNFVGDSFGKLYRRLELIPIVVMWAMVLLTPFTGALYYFDAEGRYARGGAYEFYAIIYYFYFAETVFDLLVISVKRKEKDERYAVRTMLISLIMLIGSFINTSVIPSGTIFPFMPFCAVLLTMLAFYFIAAKDSDRLRQLQQQAIQDSLEHAEQASQAKSDFLSRMSHDIRTPMNAIINLVELARQEDVSDTVREYLDKTLISGKFLLGLINDILDMSRIESGKMTLHKENVSRAEFLDTIETVINPLMDEKHIHFHSEMAPGEYIISADKLRLNQIFFNLLSNAAKFTPEGGDVWFEVKNLEAENKKLKLQFVVRDNGIGMSEEFQQHLFEPFSQEHSKLSDKKQGSGLGLSIAKNLVDLMGGTISVKSKVGEGTEFTVQLEVDIVGDDEHVVSESVQEIHGGLNGIHVLLVEDNEINTYVARVILEKGGCVVTEAKNGQEALDTFAASAPFTFNAILMDVRMPVMNGLDATMNIRMLDRPDAENIPIIAMTADAFETEREKILGTGMNYYLSKPIDTAKLYDVLRQCTGKN